MASLVTQSCLRDEVWGEGSLDGRLTCCNINWQEENHPGSKLKAIPKVRGSAQTFKKLQEDLDMSPLEFTYLVGCQDKRSFEVSRRPGTKRGEKTLNFRVKITEPVAFK